MVRIGVLACAALACAALVLAEDKPIEKMRVKELRAALADRGVECVGCSEKDHFVERLREVIDMPVVTEEDRAKLAADKAEKAAQAKAKAEKAKAKKAGKKGKKGKKRKGGGDPEIDKLMEQLKASGFGGKVYGADDMDELMKEHKYDPAADAAKVRREEEASVKEAEEELSFDEL